MHNRHYRKALAFLTSLVLVGTAMPESIVTEVRSSARTKNISLADFSAEIKAMEPTSDSSGRFEKLRFDAAEKKLFQDEQEVTGSCGGFVVKNGSLRVKASYAATAKEQAEVASDATISLEEARSKIGCEVLEKADGSMEIISPFQLARLIVKSENAVDSLNAVSTVEDYRNLHVLQFETPADAYTAYQHYQKLDNIEFVTPDRVVHTCMNASTPSYAKELCWGNQAIGSKEFCERLTSEHEELPDIKVAVIDTGCYADHELLRDRIADGAKSFIYKDREFPIDVFGHGTHCAGIIASSTADNVSILPIAVLGDDGCGDTLEIYCGMMYAAEQNADVVSMSLSGYGEEPLEDEAAKVLAECGTVLCAAASNDDGDDARNYAPANCPDAITVSAIDSDYELAYFSNIGEIVDIAAPGVDILSAGNHYPTEYVSMDGTSMATPYVAACCADILSAQPDLSVDELKALLFANAVDLGEEGRDEKYGYGMVCLKDFDFHILDCAAPNATLESGSYEEAQSTLLECDTEGAAIYYTTDGTAPDKENGILYQNKAIKIGQSMTLRAVAMLDGKYSSERSFVYEIARKDTANALEIKDGVLTAYHGCMIDLNLSDEKITEIGEGAFAGNDTLETVILPSSLKKIGARAFADCDALCSVEGKCAETIGDEAFRSCDVLYNFRLNTDVQKLGEACFMECPSLNECIGLESLTELPAYTFCGDEQLSVQLPNLTVIGDYAFKNSVLESETLCWEKLTKIGAHAMENSSIQNSVLSLPNVTEFGEYALASSYAEQYEFSEKLTALPEGLLMNCTLMTKLSAPNVTKIGAYALALSLDAAYRFPIIGFENPLEWDIDCTKVTEVGAAAFAGLWIDQDLSFDSLTSDAADSFAGFMVSQLNLPSVKRIRSNSEQLNSTFGLYFFANVLCMENLEEVYSDDIGYATALVCGDKVKKFSLSEQNPMLEEIMLAAPKDSLVETYAKNHGYSFYVSPFMKLWYPTEDVICYDEISLEADLLGFGLTGKWYVYKNGELDFTSTQSVVSWVPTEPCEYAVHYEMLKDGEMLDEASFGFHVVDDGCSYDITYDKQMIVKRPEKKIEYFEDGTSYSYYPTVNLVYKPTESSRQQVRYSAGSMFISDVDGTQASDYSEKGCIWYTFEAGKTYVLRLDCYDAYSVVLITDEDAEFKDFSENGSASFDSLEMSEDELPPAAEPIVEYYVPNEEDEYSDEEDDYDYDSAWVTLDEESYEMIPEPFKDVDNYLYYYFVGKGEYFGMVGACCTILQPIEAEKPVTTSNMRETYTFVPEKDGEYVFMSAPADTTIADCKRDVVMPNFDLSLIVQTSDYETVMEDYGIDLYWTNGQLYDSMYLEAGVEYWFNVGNYTGPDEPIVPMTYLLTQKKQSLYPCNVMEPTYDMVDGKLENFNIAVLTTDEEETPLTEGEDFTCEYWYDYAESPSCLFYCVKGIGDYYGTILKGISLLNGTMLSDGKIPIELNKPFVVNKNRNLFSLTMEEGSKISLEVLEGTFSDGLAPTVSFVEIDEYYIASYGMLNAENPTVTLDMYSIDVLVNVRTLEDDNCVLMLKSEECKPWYELSVAYTDRFDYTGEVCVPEDVVITTEDGDVLEEGVDYILRFEDTVECGWYQFEVEYIKDYFGTTNCEYFIMNEIHTENAQELKLGENTAVIETPGEFAVYHIDGDIESYILSKEILDPVVMYIYNKETDFLSRVCDGMIGEYSTMFYKEEGDEYLLVGFEGNFRTGEIPFQFNQGINELWNCTYECPETVMYTGEDVRPDIQIYDGEKLLQEGTDYELQMDCNSTGVGYASYTFVGKGGYSGEIDVPTAIYYPNVQDYFGAADTENIDELCTAVAVGMAVNFCPQTINGHAVYCLLNNSETPLELRMMYSGAGSFTEDWTEWAGICNTEEEYDSDNFEVPDPFYYMHVLGFVYDSDGNFVELSGNYQKLTIAPNDCVYVAVVASPAYTDITDLDITFHDIAEHDPLDDVVSYYTLDGVTYMLCEGYEAYVVSFDEERRAVVLHDWIEVNGNMYYLSGFSGDDEQLAYAADQILFYLDDEGTMWSESQALADKYGWHTASLAWCSVVKGDWNVNGELDVMDAGSLNLSIAEGNGVVMTPQMEETDMNDDGIVNVLDVLMILQQAQTQA